MRLDRKELVKYPDVLSKEQLRIVGHMSKRTATYLLESKILPAKHTGKKTRCYWIKKEDIIDFFDDLEAHPNKYATPPKWYSEKKKLKASPYKLRCMPNAPVDTAALRSYYKKKLKKHNPVMTVAEVSEFTGYNKSTVTKWIRAERLEAFVMPRIYMIPKEFLLKWITSDTYNNVERKSKIHLRALMRVSE